MSDPITREETFLAAAAGDAVTLPNPITRVEQYLKRIAERTGTGGGSPDSSQNAALTFTGAVSATYDGSVPVSVEIPTGGGETETVLMDVTTEEEVSEITLDLSEEQVLMLSESSHIKVLIIPGVPTAQENRGKLSVSVYCNYVNSLVLATNLDSALPNKEQSADALDNQRISIDLFRGKPQLVGNLYGEEVNSVLSMKYAAANGTKAYTSRKSSVGYVDGKIYPERNPNNVMRETTLKITTDGVFGVGTKIVYRVWR